MRTFLQDLLVQMKGIWSRLEGPQRLVVGAVMLATVVGLGAIVWFAGQPSYETVYTARTSDEIEKVQTALQQSGISFTVDPTGQSFLVERSKVSLANMAIAKEGLNGPQMPQIGGTSSLMEDAATKAYKLDANSRAHAEAAIRQLDGVVSVTVTASRPQTRIAFRDRQREMKASATVLLRLRPGAPWEGTAYSAASIASSQLMVPMQNIDVVSTTGSQRWSYDPDRASGAGSSDFLAMQRAYGEERTQIAQDRLEQLWPGKISVQVTVELDPSWEIRSERVVPEEAIVASEEVQKDSTDTPASAQDAGVQKSKNETKNRKFVTDIGERRVGKMMPDLKRMSVAVLYDRSLEQDPNFKPEDLKKTVKAIVGWDPSRDSEDAFSTLVGDFQPLEPVEAVATGPGFADVALRWGPTIGQILGVIVVVLFLRGLFRSTGAPTSSNEPAPLPEVPEESLAPEEQQKRMRREIERSIASDPAALAKMLEQWLMEQKA